MTMPFHRIAIYLLYRIVLRFLSSTSCAAKSYANKSAGLNAINKCNHPFIHLPFGENTKKNNSSRMVQKTTIFTVIVLNSYSKGH